jgi:MFS family permease
MSADEDVAPPGRAEPAALTLSPGPLEFEESPAAATRDGTLIATVLAFAMTVVAIGSTVVVPLIGELAVKLHSSPTTAAWSLISFTLIAGVTTPVFGRLGDMFGYRKVLITCFALLTVGTIVCATAPSMPVFLTGRVLQALTGGVIPVAIGVVRNHVRADRVRLAIGIIVAGEGVGVGIGFILGGLLQSHPWNVAFWVLLVPAALSLALIVGIVPGSSTEQTGGRFDVLGAILLMGGTFSLLLPLSEGSSWGWASGSTIGLFVAGIVLLLVFGAWEVRQREPVIDLHPFRSPRFLLPNLAGICFGAAVGAVFLLFVGYAEIPHAIGGYGFGASTLHAGSFLLPDAVCVLIAAPLMGIIAHRQGARPVLITGAVLVALTFLLLAPAHNQQWELYLGSAVFGTAVACSLTGMYSIVSEAVGPDKAGMAQGINSLVYSLGAAIGSAATTALLSAHLIPHTPLSTASGYTHAYIMCGLFGIAAIIIAVTEAALARRDRARPARG